MKKSTLGVITCFAWALFIIVLDVFGIGIWPPQAASFIAASFIIVSLEREQ